MYLRKYSKKMANVLTSSRILCALMLLIFPAFSGWYYLFYLLGGFTDAIDGTVARKQGKATASGAVFDSVADLIFALSVTAKIICNVIVPKWLVAWIASIAILKVANIAVGFLKHNRFVTVHSALNKICGTTVFITPLFIGIDYAWQIKTAVIIFVCSVASIATVQELVFVWNGTNIE